MDLKSNPSPMASDEAWEFRNEFDQQVPKFPQSILFNNSNEMENFLKIFGKNHI